MSRFLNTKIIESNVSMLGYNERTPLHLKTVGKDDSVYEEFIKFPSMMIIIFVIVNALISVTTS